MKTIFLSSILILFSLPLLAGKNTGHPLYVGTFTSEGAEGIYLCRFDTASGSISLEKVFKAIDNPNFLQVSPDRKLLFAVTRPKIEVEKSGGYIQSYRILPGGDLDFINKQASHGADPCHVDVSSDGRFAAIATYGGGTLSLYGISPGGKLQEASTTIKNEGSGPNRSRQQTPHAHSVLFSPDGSRMFSADLGTDRLNIFEFKKGQLKPAPQPYVQLSPGAGPRHFRFHPDSKTIYVINELNSTIAAFQKKGNKWDELQTISTLPAGYKGENYCADIQVSADGRYLYGSNRGHNSIAVFTISPTTKKLEWVTAVPVHGNWPRNLSFSPTGKYLLSANQKSGNITVFRIDRENGIPEFTGHEVKIPAPVCLTFQ